MPPDLISIRTVPSSQNETVYQIYMNLKYNSLVRQIIKYVAYVECFTRIDVSNFFLVDGICADNVGKTRLESSRPVGQKERTCNFHHRRFH